MHGAEVEATTEAFRDNLKGAPSSPVEGTTDGVVRWRKNGRYIDLAPDGKIVSFVSQE
jgi:hypothetical protein